MAGRIDQVLAGFAEGDAISNEATILQDIFRRWGKESEIYVDVRHVSPVLREQSRPLESYTGGRDDVLIHHYGIASPAVDTFLKAPGRKVLIYHNITPTHFYRGFDDGIARQLEQARAGLRTVLSAADAIWADSEFNASELRELGTYNIKVLPLLFSIAHFNLPPDPAISRKFRAPMKNLLFVGRVAPNKRIEDLIQAFAWYHRLINRQSRLVIVGSERSTPRYYLMLAMLASDLKLQNVCFERFASPQGLTAYYEMADVFVTASEHEGYCLPLVEAMHKGVPVIARRGGGIPEALGGAGVMYEDLGPGELAQLIHLVLTDKRTRRDVLESQRRRMADLNRRQPEEELRVLLKEIR